MEKYADSDGKTVHDEYPFGPGYLAIFQEDVITEIQNLDKKL